MKHTDANTRLVHDVSMRTTDAILAALVVTAVDYDTAHRLVYVRVTDGLNTYLVRRQRELNRLGTRLGEDPR